MSGDLVDTTEMYLKAIYELEEEGVPPLRARLVERLGQSKPTVSETVARLQRDGLLTIVGSRTIELSEEGRAQATNVMRKHRLAERLLLEVLHVPWVDIHDEACRWEHVISDEVEAKIADLVGSVATDPFGNPIPAALSAGPGVNAAGPSGLVRVVDFIKERPEGGVCRVKRIGEVLQTDTRLLQELCAAGIVADAEVTISEDAGEWSISGPSGRVPLTEWLQSHLLVEA
ncbi:metal-dependent transcriptional regulator [Arcanobacterium haemolyticum]|nr:metal-dependent transcriptional regulator [Arcanobacterium haemolyticum]